MATSFPRPEGGDKRQGIPKVMLALVVLILVGAVIAFAYTQMHPRRPGRPADAALGPQAGAAGPMNGTRPTQPAGQPGTGLP